MQHPIPRQVLIMHKLIHTQAHLGSILAVTSHYQPFLYGFRNKLAIIHLDTTLRYLRRACAFLHHINNQPLQRARFLLVNTNTHFNKLIKQTALYSNHTFINTPWIGGLLTNSSHISQHNEGPNCIIVLNATLSSTAIQEAYRLRIPSVALVDANTPKTIHAMISYPIPANAYSLPFVYILCNCIVLLSAHNHVARQPGLIV